VRSPRALSKSASPQRSLARACVIIRAIIAQFAATLSMLSAGRFTLGLGAGENSSVLERRARSALEKL
jgi:alkanesulfonate monooxygenase SsuD/methylene tetrahydromethanopterin reductase-like flavin-dependent oxidoreductase (luciferase family)